MLWGGTVTWASASLPAAIDPAWTPLATTVLTLIVVPLATWVVKRLIADYQELWESRRLLKAYKDAGVEVITSVKVTEKVSAIGRPVKNPKAVKRNKAGPFAMAQKRRGPSR